MIKSKTVSTISDVESIYCGWSNSIEVTDKDGNELTIELNDELIIKLAEKLQTKADEIRQKRLEEAQAKLEELNESTDTAD